MSQQDKDVIKIMQDPVLWAEKHLGAKPRWYQEQIMRHPHNRIVLRMGRRLGKCVAGDQRLLNADTGEYKTLDELYKTQNRQVPLHSMQDNYRFHKTASLSIEDNGVKPVFEVKTKHGAKVKLTGNHPVFTVDGWKEVDLLQVGECIAKPKSLPVFGKHYPGENTARMVGYLTGGFQMHTHTPLLRVGSEDYAKDILAVAKNENVTLVRKSKINYFAFDEFDKYEKYMQSDATSIPDEVFTYDKESLACFMSAFYEVNGWAYANRIAEIGFSTSYPQLATDVKHLLLRFGIESNIIDRKVNGKPYQQVMIYAKNDILQFVKEIGRYSFKNYDDVKNKADELDAKDYIIPKEMWLHVEKVRQAKGLKKVDVSGSNDKLRTKQGIPEEKAAVYAQNLGMPELYNMATGDIYWEEVVSITPAGKAQTYDVFVPETHNLIIEDILVHNTWTMTAHMLWVAFTNMGGKVKGRGAVCVVATPYDNQAKLIYDQLREFIANSSILTDSVKSMTKNPYYIEFKNGGKIKLFTAGTKTGSGGASLRGQQADYLYMDKTLSLLAVR